MVGQEIMKVLIKNIQTIIIALVIGAGLVMGWVLGMEYLEVKRQEVSNQAYDECARMSSYTREVGEGTVITPVDEVYEKCLREKGY